MLLNTLTVLVVIAFVVSGLSKILGLGYAELFVSRLSTSKGASIFIGAIEIIGGVGLIFPSSRFYVGTVMVLVMVGAVGSHFGGTQGYRGALLPGVLFLLISLLLYVDNTLAAEEEEEALDEEADAEEN